MEKLSAVQLFLETILRCLYKIEEEVRDDLVTLEKTASSRKLKDILRDHRRETEDQIRRLEDVFTNLEIDIKVSGLQGVSGMMEKGKELLKQMVDLNFTGKSKGIEGILNEGKERMRHFGATEIKDIVLADCAQKVEHFEIAYYKTACSLANMLDQQDVEKLLNTSLEEEIAMAERLAEVVENTLCEEVKSKK